MIGQVLADPRFAVLKEFMATPPAQPRRGAAAPELAFEAEAPADAASVLAVRHPSGAVSFHTPEVLEKARRGGKSVTIARFHVVLRGSSAQGTRRGVLGQAVRAIILKVVGKIADRVLPALARAWEQRAWSAAGRQEGWHLVTRKGLQNGQLQPALPQPDSRSLLLIHGTFSHATSAFGALASSDFFDRVAAQYDSRVFAFNHFTISRTPEENARMLLEALDETKTYSFDVVTHSRGGLVLRTLSERPDLFGSALGRLQLGKAVLVASPNEGTPLATADRWGTLLNWVANLLELFPDNPWTEAASWVVDGLTWIANRVSGGIPGLGAMDAAGETVAALQDDPPPPAGMCSALVANYRAEQGVVQRAIDIGADLVFAMANDLVVPTEGGWRTGRQRADFVPSERIGCFGLGGNLLPGQPSAVMHTNYFQRPETVDFLVRALTGQQQGLPVLANDRPLLMHRAGVVSAVGSTRLPDVFVEREVVETPATVTVAATVTAPAAPAAPGATVVQLDVSDGEVPPLHLILLPEPETAQERSARRGATAPGDVVPLERQASTQMLAMYGSARVLEPFFLRSAHASGMPSSTRWHDIIAMQERIKAYVANQGGATLPTDPELIEFGINLFETLFPNRVRRLYDEARARSQGRRLDIIFTSMIPWVADKPWEFAYDPHRHSFLAMEDVQFVRNVLTAVPAQNLLPHTAALRILVVVAQPIGQAKLSVEEEITVIKRGFEPLISASLADVQVLPRATPNTLHGRLSTEQFDVVHFIGHGEFDADREQGYLLFEDETGSAQRVNDNNLRNIFCQRGVRLLFLNACETGRGGRADFNQGVAPAIVAGGMPVVVANQFKVLDVSATSFAQRFYWSLAAGLTVGDAARESRIAVNYSFGGETIDWAVPVVFARDPNARFCKPAQRTEAVLTAPTPSTVRRDDRAPFVVGVWDVQHMYPELEDLVEQWNQAQSFYQFQVVDPSVPIGGWQVHNGETYLRSDVLGKTLKATVKQLGVDTLVCLIGAPMTDGEILNLFADRDPKPVLLLSTSGFEVPDDQVPAFLTNLIAGQLILQRADLQSVETGPKNSPRYYNEERSLDILIEPQKLDASTRQEIKRALGATADEEIAAVEELFRLFSVTRRRRRRGASA
jgi:hypothetical protein